MNNVSQPLWPIPDSYSVKLIDFGFTDRIERLQTSGRGTPGYCAPETYADNINDGYYGQFVDIFALGVILYNLGTSS